MRPLEDRYFERMASAIGDKSRILPWVLPGHAIDVGAGGGELTARLAELPEVTATAVDFAPQSLQRLQADPRFTTVRGLAGDDAECFTDEPASTVVFNSVLHEVYSYSDDRMAAVERALEQAHRNLAAGGRIIIRDGVMPVAPSRPARFLAPDDDLVSEYLRRSPHPELALTMVGRWWCGTRHAVSEALLTLTWGRESLPREALERYELHTLDGYSRFLARHGFRTIHDDMLIQPGYVEGLCEYRVESAGRRWFPPTNGLWVAERA